MGAAASTCRLGERSGPGGWHTSHVIFEPFTIRNVTFKNRLVRSSIGGRTAYYDGTVSNAWKNFERRFAEKGVAAIVSATLNVNPRRWSPLEYPQISDDKFIHHLADGIQAVRAHDCRYFIQIGDGGSHVQTSLLPQKEDSYGPSGGFDLLYGYTDRRREMTVADIEQSVHEFGEAARRVRETGADGVELTISKGYLIHQFLNPAINRRRDRYGGSVEKRFQFLREIMTSVRSAVGDDYIVGVRLSAKDMNYLPLNLRLPFPWRPRMLLGNGVSTYVTYAKWLRDLGADYLHVSNGYGFINPGETPGDFPVDEVRMFYNSTRHLSRKAGVRASIVNAVPKPMLKAVAGIGWGGPREGANMGDAQRLREEVGLPVIANGGFQRRSLVESALSAGAADLVSMARPLLANADLVEMFRSGGEEPERPCTFCNRCAIRTTLFPLGCYDRSRFASDEDMEAQILEWSARPDLPGPAAGTPSA